MITVPTKPPARPRNSTGQPPRHARHQPVRALRRRMNPRPTAPASATWPNAGNAAPTSRTASAPWPTASLLAPPTQPNALRAPKTDRLAGSPPVIAGGAESSSLLRGCAIRLGTSRWMTSKLIGKASPRRRCIRCSTGGSAQPEQAADLRSAQPDITAEGARAGRAVPYSVPVAQHGFWRRLRRIVDPDYRHSSGLQQDGDKLIAIGQKADSYRVYVTYGRNRSTANGEFRNIDGSAPVRPMYLKDASEIRLKLCLTDPTNDTYSCSGGIHETPAPLRSAHGTREIAPAASRLSKAPRCDGCSAPVTRRAGRSPITGSP